MTPPSPLNTSNPGPMCYWDPSPPANICEAPPEPLVCLAEEKPVDTYTLSSPITATVKVRQLASSSLTKNFSAALQNFGCQGNPTQPPAVPIAEILPATGPAAEPKEIPIPITLQMGKALVDLFSDRWPGKGAKLLKDLHIKEYIHRDLVFERDQPNDGIIYVKEEEGKRLLKLNEAGTIENLEHGNKMDFCTEFEFQYRAYTNRSDGTIVGGERDYSAPKLQRTACDDPMRLIITALYGESELNTVKLSKSEKQLAEELRDDMGLELD